MLHHCTLRARAKVIVLVTVTGLLQRDQYLTRTTGIAESYCSRTKRTQSYPSSKSEALAGSNYYGEHSANDLR
jgi:hypothetical protein